MCDSDEGGDSGRSGMDLTGFLFGNIDERGQLEDDSLLDGESKRMLSSLTRLGLGSMLSEVLEEEEITKEDEEKGLCTVIFLTFIRNLLITVICFFVVCLF